MKKQLMTLSAVAMLANPIIAQAQEDVRAVWISTVYNIDFPKNVADPTKQQQEFIEYLEELQEIGINTLMVQVRPMADALYSSTINPWSSVLTGTQGQDPGYDPLAFMIEEAHKRGMEIHAWLNPYRVTTTGTDLEALSVLNPARQNPHWTFEYNNALYYNPELEVVKTHIEETVREIVTNYDIDGIHFDDYFYPWNYPLPEGEGLDGPTANARREHINDMVERVSKVIKETDSSVDFGISPIGIWKNDYSDLTGSSTNGGESYYTVFADTRTWIQEEWIDYVVPQIYWEIGHSSADYETLAKWWAKEVEGTDVDLYIGHGLYKDEVAVEVVDQLIINEKYDEIDGSVFFTMHNLLDNDGGSRTALTNYYNGTYVPSDSASNNELEVLPNGEIQLIINNQLVQTDIDPFIIDGTTFVPLRLISETLGAKVYWDPDTKIIRIDQ
ncbi:MAG: hypothetical protein ATN35_11470 [Epulopiscium sp. Nele67-Bin004]|nr:MAG: hypothetical protein ATN35_11470 [Epulopiscium sp. Nele67-Bin004]